MSVFSETFKINEHWSEYINLTRAFKYNWAEGAYRSSKSVSNTLAFALYLENTKDTVHLVIASTVASARNIVEDGDGALGLKYYFGNKYKETKYKGNDAGIIKTKNGKKVVVYLGGAMESSFKLFRGWSVGGIVLEELNLLHKNTINEAKGRILLAKDPKVFISHNPVSSRHPIYEWLEELEQKDLVNYDHSTLEDNPALTEERKNQIKSEFDPDSLFYKQYILGQRVDAEGLVYKLYDYSVFDEFDPKEYIDYVFTADIGDGPSATVFQCLGLRKGFKSVDVLFEYRHRNDDKENKMNPKQPFQYAEDLKNFIKSSIKQIGKFPKSLIIDGSPSFYRDCKTAFKDGLGNLTIKFPYKEEISERIRYSNSLIYTGRLRFKKSCKETIYSFKMAQYDPKAYEKGEIKYWDEPTLNTRIDEIDACLYGVWQFIVDLKRVSYSIQTDGGNNG